jgi:hypothetical protein
LIRRSKELKKLLPIAIFIVLAAGAVYFLVFVGDSTPSSNQDQVAEVTESETIETQQPNIDDSKKYTTAQVAEKNTAQECWTIINGKVYDLTSYIPSHPGGDDILRACGTDGTTLFEDRTTNDGQVVGGGGSHSSSAKAALDSLQIGSLQD